MLVRLLLTAPLWSLLMTAVAVAAPLKVGVSGEAPFVERAGDKLGGISLTIWREIAGVNNFDYLDALAAGELDVAIGPITITPQRIAQPGFEFTQPYFYAEEAVLVPRERANVLERLRPLFGVAALSSVGLLLVSLFAVGNLIWLAERRSNHSQFPRHYLHGLGNAMWFALVTLTTVGYGDRAPVSKTGRAITAVWMVISLIAVSSITAGLASAFTLALARNSRAPITNPAQLRGAVIAVVRGTTSELWADRMGAKSLVSDNLKQAIDLVEQKRAEGVIYDRPALRYFIAQNPKTDLQIAPFDLASQTYGFAVRSGSPLRRPINVTVMSMHQVGEIRNIVDAALP
ncbi:MAG: transporter substrate-binding domain-containing protein [Synechococcus sp.]